MWAPEPAPAPAPDHGGTFPPDDPARRVCRLQYRPRFLDGLGVGPWQTRRFDTPDQRAAFVACWSHDFEMKLAPSPLES